MLAALRRVIRRWPRLSETCGPTDRDLAELGLTREQAERLAALPPAVPQRIQAMAAIFGLTPEELEANRADWIELAEICAGCSHTSACRRTLAKGTGATVAETGFCPNAGHYGALSAGLTA